MVTALFDTNILIDHFDGIAEATDELMAYDQAFISTISWIEVACGMTPQQAVTSSCSPDARCHGTAIAH